jgi:hypothetical protein
MVNFGIDSNFKGRTGSKGAEDKKVFCFFDHPHPLTEFLLHHPTIDAVPKGIAGELGLVEGVADMRRDDRCGNDLGMGMFERGACLLPVVSEDGDEIESFYL